MLPNYALFWSAAGDDDWSCAGLYDQLSDALREFREWPSERPGRLVLVDMLERATRDVSALTEEREGNDGQ